MIRLWNGGVGDERGRNGRRVLHVRIGARFSCGRVDSGRRRLSLRPFGLVPNFCASPNYFLI